MEDAFTLPDDNTPSSKDGNPDETESNTYDPEAGKPHLDELVALFPDHHSELLDYDEIINTMTDDYLIEITTRKNDDQIPAPQEIKRDLLQKINTHIADINVNKRNPKPSPFLTALLPQQIAKILIKLHHVILIPADFNQNTRYDMLCVYVNEGRNAGTYSNDEYMIDKAAAAYNYLLKITEIKELQRSLRANAPRKLLSSDPDLVPVQNGVFDYKSKTLLPFTPDMIFMSKLGTPYNPDAENPIIHNPDDDSLWDVETWMEELSDDPEIVKLLWKVVGATVRPYVRWNKSAWLYSDQGNNGKGTFCELVRNLVGRNNTVSIPLTDFSKDFMLEPLQHASCILVDENDVGVYLDRVGNLKAIVTNDVISINRKGLMPVSYRFWGFMIQCLNEFPQVRDRSESFYRRQLFIPFTKSFRDIERHYIKQKYLFKNNVLEYVLKKILTDIPDYYQLEDTEATKVILDDYKETNDPVREFWNEHKNRFVWDLLPFTFLYDLYKSWFVLTNPSGKLLGRNKFINSLLQNVNDGDTWFCENKNKNLRVKDAMSKPEKMILTYKLDNWKNSIYTGKDVLQICIPDTVEMYRGLKRFTQQTP